MTKWIECRPANKELMIQFPDRAHAWVASQVPGRGQMKGETIKPGVLKRSELDHVKPIRVSSRPVSAEY